MTGFDNEYDYRLGWGSGWSSAIEKMRVHLANEIMVVEARLKLNMDDFQDEEHPAVLLVDQHLKSLRRLARDMDILLPGMWGNTE